MLSEEIYDLVTIKQYNGIRNNCHVWIPMGYAIVIRKENNKAVCLRDENIEYEYLSIINEKSDYDYSNVEVGTIRIFSTHHLKYDSIVIKTRLRLNIFMYASGLDFSNDTKYGHSINNEKSKEKIIKK